MAISDWSSTPSANATVLGVNIGEGCPPGNVNDAMRKIMADVATGVNFSLLGTFLASTTLGQARTALGVGTGSTSANAFDALTNEANKVPYMTGSDAWAKADLTSFGRQVIATGDATALQTLIGGVNVVAQSIAAASGYIKLNLGGTVFILQWVDATVGANTTTSVSFPTAFASWSRAWCRGSSYSTGSGDNPPAVSSSSTTAASVVSGLGTSATTTVFAIGV